MSNEEPSSPKSPNQGRKPRANHRNEGGRPPREPNGNANEPLTEEVAPPPAEAAAPSPPSTAAPSPPAPEGSVGVAGDEKPRLDLAALKEMGITKLASVAKSLEIPGA